MTTTNPYPVDSTVNPCCRTIGDRHGRDCTQVIDPATFTRLAEVDAYAKRAGCDRAEAMRQLVNMALSLLCWQCQLNIGDDGGDVAESYKGLCPRCRRAAIKETNARVARFIKATDHLVVK